MQLAAKLAAAERSREGLAAARVVLIAQMAARQHGECSWCGERLFPAGTEAEPPQVDHILPVSAGNPCVGWNYQALHARCNREKRGRLTARAFALAEEHGVELADEPTPRLATRLPA